MGSALRGPASLAGWARVGGAALDRRLRCEALTSKLGDAAAAAASSLVPFRSQSRVESRMKAVFLPPKGKALVKGTDCKQSHHLQNNLAWGII